MSTTAPVEYEVVTHNRAGRERVHRYSTDEVLEPGDVLRLDGRFWLIETVEEGDEASRAQAVPARYRLRLHYPDGHDEFGAFRRYRADAPRLGHSFTTVDGGQAVSWEVMDETLAYDDETEPFLDLPAERDYAELEEPEELPDHELEHALAQREEQLPAAAAATFSRAQEAGLSVELVALEAGELPDWDEARRAIDVLIFEEVEDDLFELCGVDPDRDPRNTWLDTVKERLREDLDSFRADVEGDHDEIEEWDFLDGRILAAVGNADDEADPYVGYGWMCRLVDSGALRAGGFHRVRKAELEVSE
jgi:hypothetical protein